MYISPLNIEPSAPLFVRTNVKLAQISADLDRAKGARDVMDGIPGHLRREERERVRDALTDSIARALHNICCGMEGILEDIAETVDGEKPSGDRWHSSLLDQLSLPTSVRPAVIDDNSELRRLMRFRHVFRNVYGEPLRREDVLSRLKSVEETVIPNFLTGLEQLEKYMKVDAGSPVPQASGSEHDDGAGP